MNGKVKGSKKKALQNSKDDADKNFTKKPADSATQPCPLEQATDKVEPKLVAVEILNGDDDTVLSGSGSQFVNLPKEDKWVDEVNTKNKDRLSDAVRVRVRFNKPGGHAFKIKLVANSANLEYSDEEKGRNSHFKIMEEEKSFTTAGDGTKILIDDFHIVSGGKQKFSFEAKDNKGTTKKSAAVQTQRLIYLQHLKMRGVPSGANMNTCIQEYRRHGITVKSLAPIDMDRMLNISRSATDNSQFKQLVKQAYQESEAKDKEPYVVTLAYTGHLAVMQSKLEAELEDVDVGENKGSVNIPIKDSDGKGKFLWNHIAANEEWFVSAKYIPNSTEEDEDEDEDDKEVTIAKDKCLAIPEYANHENYPNHPDLRYRSKVVEVDVSSLPEGKGTIQLLVNVVDMMRGGLSYPGTNLIVVCTQSYWSSKSSKGQNEIVVHEMGHKIGMVPDGTRKLPDKTPNHYLDKGHVGDHCHKSVPEKDDYNNTESVQASTCVMFGSTNGKSAFCEDCAKAAKKVDINKGWSAL